MLGEGLPRLRTLLPALFFTLLIAPPWAAAQTPQASGGRITAAASEPPRTEPKRQPAAKKAVAKKAVAKKAVAKKAVAKKPAPKAKALKRKPVKKLPHKRAAKPKPLPKPAPVRRPAPAAEAPAKAAPAVPPPPLKSEAPKVLLSPEQAEARYQQAVSLERSGDRPGAFRAYEEAAESGHALAQKKLGDLYGTGGEAVQRDYETSLRWYSKAREQGVQVPKPFVYPGVRR